MTTSRGEGARVDTVAFERLRSDWDRLGLASGRIFGTWEWASIWWRHYGRGRRLALVPIRGSDGAVAAILPLFLQVRQPLRIARFVGHAGGDEMGPICAPEDLAAVGRLLERGAGSRSLGADLLLAESIPRIEWGAHLPGTALRPAHSPAIALEGFSWDGFLASLSRGLRREIVHGERRLRRRYSIAYRVTSDAATLDADLDTFFELHRVRFPSGSSLLQREPFYRDFARAALQRGWLRLAILDVDGHPGAARLDFRFAGVHFAYNAGRDRRWDRESLGVILRAMTLRDAIESDAREYRFLRGGEAYKARWATHDRHAVTLAIPRTALGRIATLSAGALGSHRAGRSMLSRALDG